MYNTLYNTHHYIMLSLALGWSELHSPGKLSVKRLPLDPQCINAMLWNAMQCTPCDTTWLHWKAGRHAYPWAAVFADTVVLDIGKKGFAFKYIVLCCSFCPHQIPSACSLLVHIAPYALQFSLRLFYEHLCTVLVQCAWLKMHSHVLRISLRLCIPAKVGKKDQMRTVCILGEKYTWVHQKASTNTHFLTAGALTECVQHNLSLAK